MSSISTYLDQRRLADLASDPDYVPRPGSTGPREFTPATDSQPAYRAAVNAGADIAFAALRCAQAAHQGLALRRHNDLSTARIPCVSDADPAEFDESETAGTMREQIEQARCSLSMAEHLLDTGDELSARSCLNEAIEWLEVTE